MEKLEATDEEVNRGRRRWPMRIYFIRNAAGLQTNLSERAANLSQGQRQMLAIARPSWPIPASSILDEATSSVDMRPNCASKGAAAPDEVPDKLRDRPPPEHDPRCGQGGRDQQGRDRGDRHAPGTSRPEGLRSPAVHQPVQGAGDLRREVGSTQFFSFQLSAINFKRRPPRFPKSRRSIS